MPHSAVYDLGLHCLPITLLGVSRLQCVKGSFCQSQMDLSYYHIYTKYLDTNVRMCTILVNSLEDLACPVKVWLGKLTALDMAPSVDWVIKPQHKQKLLTILVLKLKKKKSILLSIDVSKILLYVWQTV